MKTFSLSPILRSFRLAKAKLEGGSPETSPPHPPTPPPKKNTLVLWASSPVFWKARMKDGGLKIDDEGKRIRDQSSPFHRQRKISSRTRNTKLDTEVWGKYQKTLQLGWTQQRRARSKYRRTTLIDKHQKPQYQSGVSGTLWHTVTG